MQRLLRVCSLFLFLSPWSSPMQIANFSSFQFAAAWWTKLEKLLLLFSLVTYCHWRWHSHRGCVLCGLDLLSLSLFLPVQTWKKVRWIGGASWFFLISFGQLSPSVDRWQHNNANCQRGWNLRAFHHCRVQDRSKLRRIIHIADDDDSRNFLSNRLLFFNFDGKKTEFIKLVAATKMIALMKDVNCWMRQICFMVNAYIVIVSNSLLSPVSSICSRLDGRSVCDTFFGSVVIFHNSVRIFN